MKNVFGKTPMRCHINEKEITNHQKVMKRMAGINKIGTKYTMPFQRTYDE